MMAMHFCIYQCEDFIVTVEYSRHTKSISAFNLVLVDSGYSFKISHSAGAGTLAVLGFEGPSV